MAIACAALYFRYIGVHQQTSSSDIWKKYLKKLETLEKRASTERAYERTSRSYRSSMTAAVILALEKLVQEPMFEHMVPFLALGSSTPVNLDLIVRYLKEHDPDYDEEFAAAEIVKCSLLLMVFTDDSSKMQVKMHQVVHAVFKKYLLDKYSEEQIAEFILLYIEILSTSAQHDPQHFDLNFYMTSKMMAPHLKSLSHWLAQLWELILIITSDKSALKSILCCFGDICRQHFFLWEAKAFFQYAFQIAKDTFDRNDHSKLSFLATILTNQGLIFHENCELQEAELYYNRALDILRTLHPSNTSSPEIADLLNKLGTLYYTLSQREIFLMEHLKRDHVLQQYGLDDPFDLRSSFCDETICKEKAELQQNGLDSFDRRSPFCDETSYKEKAKIHFQRSLDMRKQLYGFEHPHVASSMSNIGCIYSVLGDLETAKDLFQRSYALRERIYGKEHPFVADSLNNLGILYSKMDLTKEAIQYLKKAMEMRKKLFFYDHAVIADSYNNLALAYQYNGQFEKANECFEEALRVRERVSGKDHAWVGRVLLNFSDLYMRLGEPQKCKDLRFRARQILEPFTRRRWRHQGKFILNGEPRTSTGQDGRYLYAILCSAILDPLPLDLFPYRAEST